MLCKNVYAYLDDLIIYSRNGDSHLDNLKAILLMLKDGLKARVTKYEFLNAKLTFLGYTVDGNGLHTMDNEISAIKKFPEPCTVENVLSFIALCSYYRPYMNRFDKVLSPLTQLLKKEILFQ